MSPAQEKVIVALAILAFSQALLLALYKLVPVALTWLLGS